MLSVVFWIVSRRPNEVSNSSAKPNIFRPTLLELTAGVTAHWLHIQQLLHEGRHHHQTNLAPVHVEVAFGGSPWLSWSRGLAARPCQDVVKQTNAVYIGYKVPKLGLKMNLHNSISADTCLPLQCGFNSIMCAKRPRHSDQLRAETKIFKLHLMLTILSI